jgi:riboflavin kinase/FMN adenylyltransferase
MHRLHGFESPELYRGCVVTIGNFDGVHRGHQAMLTRLKAHAAEHDVPAVVLTFDPHPITLLRPAQMPPPLSTLQRKLELLERYGVDVVIAYPTDMALLNLTAQQFFKSIVLKELAAIGMVEGPNFFFGRNRAGDVHILAALCREHELFLEVVPPEKVDGKMISSSRIRDLVREGKVHDARELLGHPYQISGVVTQGAGRGKTLGFPTANLTGIETLLPPPGVYAGRGHSSEGSWPAAINVGPNPTFGDERTKTEVHLVGPDLDLYGKELKVDFVAELRAVRKFSSSEELREQVAEDIRCVKALVSDSGTD